MNVDLKACLAGDPRAWNDFVEQCSGVIVRAVQRTAHVRPGRGDLDDPVQEVFVRLVKDDFRLLRSFDPQRASLSTWLTLVARSVTIDHLRKRRLPTLSLDHEPAGSSLPRTSDTPPLPLHLLSTRQRLVLRMLFEQEMSVGEAARLLGVDDQTIRSTKHKALSRLREHLSTRPPSDEDPAGMPGGPGTV